MFSYFCRAIFMRYPDTQRLECHDIRNYQYGQPHVGFGNIYVEGSTTDCIALVIEFAILVLSLVGIRRASQYGESHLARLLKAQGIIYFVMVFFLHMSTIVGGLDPLEADIR